MRKDGVGDRFEGIRERIYALILKAGRKGISTPEIAKALRLPRHTRVSPRISELRQMGRVGARGLKQNPESGEANAAWVATKYLSQAERQYENQLRDLWEVRRQVNRLMGKLPLEQKLAALRAFLKELSK